jgi:hypothetical protein
MRHDYVMDCRRRAQRLPQSTAHSGGALGERREKRRRTRRLPLEDDDLGSGEVYDLIFDSETRFYLKIDGPGQHVQIPFDITPSPSAVFTHDNQGGTDAFVRTPGNAAIHSRCEL